MQNSRRKFLKYAGMAGLGIAGSKITAGFGPVTDPLPVFTDATIGLKIGQTSLNEEDISVIGQYGQWASSLNGNKLPSLSFRRKEWTDIQKWHKTAITRLKDRLAIPDIGGIPEVTVKKQYIYDGLHVEELVWQLPYGRPTEAILLKPEDAKTPLPGILAFHDHGGNKYFGTRKITRIVIKNDGLIPKDCRWIKSAYSEGGHPITASG